MSIENELLPCPFCGGKPTEISHYISHGGDSNKYFLVKCENYECRVRPGTGVCGPGGYKNSSGWLETMDTNDLAKAESRARWNKRT